MSCARCGEEATAGASTCRHCGAALQRGPRLSLPSEADSALAPSVSRFVSRRSPLALFVAAFVLSLALLFAGGAAGFAMRSAPIALALAVAGPIALIALGVAKRWQWVAVGAALAVLTIPFIVFGACLWSLSQL